MESELIHKLVCAAVNSVRPEIFIPDNIHYQDGMLIIQETPFDLDVYTHIYIVSIGKAAVGMTEALDRIIGNRITEGIVLTKHIPAETCLGRKYRIMKGGHPVPSGSSINGAKSILSLLDRAGEEDLVIFLISGGGSALMTLPVNGIDLETFQEFSTQFSAAGLISGNSIHCASIWMT